MLHEGIEQFSQLSEKEQLVQSNFDKTIFCVYCLFILSIISKLSKTFLSNLLTY